MTYYAEILEPVFHSRTEEQIEFLTNLSTLKRTINCLYCQNGIKKISKRQVKDKYVFKCVTKKCTKFETTRGLRSESFLDNFNISFKDYLKLMRKFSQALTVLTLYTSLMPYWGCSEVFKKLRKLCKLYFIRNPFYLCGNEVIVNVDESLFRHEAKYHIGRHPEHEIQVLGMMDTSFLPAKGVIVVVEDKSARSLLTEIQRFVRAGSIIHSDQWAAYNNLRKVRLQHFTVNHTLNLVNPLNGVHTQYVESYWNKQKLRSLKMMGIEGDLLDDYSKCFMGGTIFATKIL